MKYQDIIELNTLLENAGIMHDFEPMYDGYHIVVYLEDMPRDIHISIIEHESSMGLEMCYGLTMKELEEDKVLGYMKVEDVLKRIKYCVKYNTIVYSTRKPYSHSWNYIKKHGR